MRLALLLQELEVENFQNVSEHFFTVHYCISLLQPENGLNRENMAHTSLKK